ncbi:MAG TPA: tyrosine-type recombinase/integrase [Verrucomicrobiota bacterium]|nr:tyrosine-type recombinase/integrase [Verrucomicrobiota bacterium]
MKRLATQCNPGSGSSSRRYRYTKALDNRKHAIRGLWRRNGKFVARITVEDDAGRKPVKWVPLEAQTVAEAQEEFRKLLVERSENRLRHIGQCPRFTDYLEHTYLPRLAASGKKPDTLVTETGHLNRWRGSIGHLHLDKIRPHHVTAHLQKLKEAGKANRTCNLALVMLRNVLKSARVDGFIKTLPVEGISWQRTEKKAHHLFTRDDIDLFCRAGLAASKNGVEFADYVRLLAFCGAREQEAIKLRWADVDFERKLLTIGADADTKNREARRVDFNPALEAHLREMHTRRAPDSQWLFPSPQRGERDERAKTFRESLLLTRAASGWACPACGTITSVREAPVVCPQCQGVTLQRKERALPEHLQHFGFHDCRHHFISFAVMSGIDFMTIARWVGHKDGGVLIGKVYGHLSNEHAQAQAARLNFGPSILEAAMEKQA